MQIVKILLLCLLLGACTNIKEIRNEDLSPDIEQETYTSETKFTYLTLNVLNGESGAYHHATLLINGILFSHYEKRPFIHRIGDGEFDIRISYVSKIRYHIPDLHINRGDSVVLDIKMMDDLSPLHDR